MRLISTCFVVVILAAGSGCTGPNLRSGPAPSADCDRTPKERPVQSWFHDNFRLSHLWGKTPDGSKAKGRAAVPPQLGTTTVEGTESDLVLPVGE